MPTISDFQNNNACLSAEVWLSKWKHIHKHKCAHACTHTILLPISFYSLGACLFYSQFFSLILRIIHQSTKRKMTHSYTSMSVLMSWNLVPWFHLSETILFTAPDERVALDSHDLYNLS